MIKWNPIQNPPDTNREVLTTDGKILRVCTYIPTIWCISGIGKFYPPESITHWAELTEIKIEGLEEYELKIPKVFENQWVKFKCDGVVRIGRTRFDIPRDKWRISGVDFNGNISEINFNSVFTKDVELLRV